MVTIDLDPTDARTHGAQQLTFLNGHYDHWCYLPVLGFVSFDEEAEQYLCAAVLRPGNATAHVGAVGILRRLLLMIRSLFPSVRIRVRLDGGFAHPDVLDFLDAEPKLEYVVAMANIQILARKAEQAMQFARSIAAVTGGTEHVYDDVNYAAGSWPRERRVIIKAEVVWGLGKEPKDNPRFVITNMRQSPQWLYEKVYCQPHCARAQVWTLRERLLKLGARVVASARHMVLHLPASCPFLADFRKVAMALGASTA